MVFSDTAPTRTTDPWSPRELGTNTRSIDGDIEPDNYKATLQHLELAMLSPEYYILATQKHIKLIDAHAW
jgi:hypothetical protein